eukprot:SAG11_NODE_6039_length_1403_cov_12.738497_1_plen_178_part_00
MFDGAQGYSDESVTAFVLSTAADFGITLYEQADDDDDDEDEEEAGSHGLYRIARHCTAQPLAITFALLLSLFCVLHMTCIPGTTLPHCVVATQLCVIWCGDKMYCDLSAATVATVGLETIMEAAGGLDYLPLLNAVRILDCRLYSPSVPTLLSASIKCDVRRGSKMLRTWLEKLRHS